MDSPLIEATNLSCGYGDLPVVRGIDLEVRAGEVVVLLGPNGAGKSTTMLTLSGDLPALGGEVRWLGSKTRTPLHRRARAGLSYVTEERSVFMHLTTAENLRVGRGDMQSAYDLFPELVKREKVKAGALSGGEQQMLALARALSRRPKALMADELSLGLAPLAVKRLLGAVRTAADNGVGVLLVEQHVRLVLGYADRVYVMRRGVIEMAGTGAEMRDRVDDIERFYLSDEEVDPSAPTAPVLQAD